MTTEFALICGKLEVAIKTATNLREELDRLKVAAVPQDDDKIKELLSKLKSKDSIRKLLVSAAGEAEGEENRNLRASIEGQINSLNAEMCSINTEIESLKNSQEIVMAELAENENKLRAEYDDAMKSVEALYAEYQEASNAFAKKVSDGIQKLKNTELGGKLPEEAEKETQDPDESEKAEDLTPADAKPDSDDDVKEYKVPDALPGLLSIMQNFEEEVCEYDLTRKTPAEDYSAELARLWRRIVPNDDERKAIIDIVKADHVKYLSQYQTRQLANSLPVELLNICDTPDSGELSAFIKARERATNYYSAGELNKWRPKFTYDIIKQLYDAVISDNYLSYFFEENTDSIEKGKRWPHFEKPVMKAFAGGYDFRSDR